MPDFTDLFYSFDWYVWGIIFTAILIPYVMLFVTLVRFRKMEEELNSAKEALLLSRRERRILKSRVRNNQSRKK